MAADDALRRRLRMSSRNLSGRAALNGAAAVLEYVARLVVGFVVNPYLLAGLGEYGYGAWQILGRLVGYISPASGRPTQALKWSIANRQASADYDDKRREVGSALAVWLFSVPVLAALGGVLVWFTPGWLEAPPSYVPAIRLAAALLVANLLMISLVAVPKSVLEGENLGFKRMGLSAGIVAAGGLLTLLALHFRLGLPGVAGATLATTLLNGALFLPIARRHVPWFGWRWPALAQIRRFVGLSGWFLVWKFVMQLLRTGDILVLGLLASVDLVATYTLTKYVPETLISFVAIIVFGITPGLGGIIGAGNFDKARAVRGELMALTWLVATTLGAAVLLWNPSFVGLWVGAEHFAGHWQNLALVLMVSQFVFIRNDANIIDLTLKLRSKVLLGVLSAGLSLLASWAFLRAGHEILGVSLGFILGNLVLTVAYPRLVGRFLEIPAGRQGRSLLRPALVTALAFGFALWGGGEVRLESWPALLLALAGTVPVLAALVWFAGLPGGMRARLLTRVRKATA